MTYSISIKKKGEVLAVQIALAPGTVRFVVGPNGSGKSSLMQLASGSANNPLVTRVHAQRSVRLSDDKVNLTPAGFASEWSHTKQYDQSANARFFDQRVDQRLNELLYRLHSTEAERNRKHMEFADAGLQQDAENFRNSNPPTLARANRILQEATLTFRVKNEMGEFKASHDGSEWFSIRRLSDGERAALLLISEVLLADKGNLILVDEPERHLHRSISAPLLTSLFSARLDCAFLVSTHDFELVLAMPSHPVMLMRTYDVRTGEWDYDDLQNADALSDDAKRSILGGRRKIVFTEGEPEKLDLPIYGALFPHVSVRAVGSGAEVERAVTGLRASGNDHWLQAFGIVDLDQRIEEGVDLEALQSKGVYALPVHSVESLYYCEEARAAVARHKGKIEKKDVATLLASAKAAALANLSAPDRLTNLASYRAVSRMRGDLMKELPTRDTVKSDPGLKVNVMVTSPLAEEIAACQNLINSGDLDAIIRRYKIRESGARGEIARNLLCRDNNEYEALVVHLLNEDDAFKDTMRQKFKNLVALLG